MTVELSTLGDVMLEATGLPLADAGSAFDPTAVDLTGVKGFDPYTQSAANAFALAASPIVGGTAIVKYTSDGTSGQSWSSDFVSIDPSVSLPTALAAGAYTMVIQYLPDWGGSGTDKAVVAITGAPSLSDMLDVGTLSYTAGRILVADGDSYEETALSGAVTLAAGGVASVTYLTIDLTDDTVGLGENAGAAITSGTNNTCIGDNAGAAITTESNNTYIGASAGAANTGVEGTFIGSEVGQNGTGNRNTLIGYRAGRDLSTGFQNVFIGMLAGAACTSEANCVSIGYGAGSNTTGARNTFIGASVGSGYTSGVDNTGVGAGALAASSTASLNTAVGRNAGAALTSGGNAIFGARAGEAITSGANNAIFGAHAGLITTGASNVFVGHTAADNATTGSKNILIGAAQDLPVASGSDQLVIGNAIFGINCDGTGTTIATDTAIGICINAPTARLHVDGSIRLAQTAVASMPSAATEGAGAVRYCTNGNAGAPCLAVSNGTDWLRVVLGAAISAT